MPLRIFKLFQPSSATHDGLSQSQREAIADLLHLCMYADNHLALAEDQVIDGVIASFDWDPRISFESFESRSIANARRAKEDAASREAFLASARERLGTEEARQRALDACTKVLAAGGTNEKESLVFKEVSAALA